MTTSPNELAVAEGTLSEMKTLRDALRKFPRLWVVVYRSHDGENGSLAVMNTLGAHVSKDLGAQILDYAEKFLKSIRPVTLESESN